MQWRNTATHFGVLAKFFHWTTAAAFIAAYIVVYYVIWFMDDTSQILASTQYSLGTGFTGGLPGASALAVAVAERTA
jgi:cytochrome b561